MFYEEATSSLHQNHILAHEISHIICDHSGSLELNQDTLRAIGFDPTLVRRVSGRTSYTSEDEREAEVMPSVIRQLMYRGRESPSIRPASGAESWDAVRRAAQEEAPPKMINLVFTGMAVVLPCFAAYWVRGRDGHRPRDTWAMAALLTSFALAISAAGTTSVGCGFALVYAAYELFALVSIGLGLGLVPVGLTLPALLWPLRQLRRHRWERSSFTALEPLWRRYLQASVRDVAAVEAKRAGLPLDGDEAPPAAGTRSRKGDLPAETAWLLLVAAASARRPAPEHAGAAS